MRTWIKRAGAASVLGLIAIAGSAAALGVRINGTESMPRGFWLSLPFRGDLEPGQYVAVCLPASWQVKHYVGPGSCTTGVAPVLKTIGAVPGDVVEMDADGVTINGQRLDNTAPLTADSVGRPLAAWPFGRYVVTPGEVFLFSSYSAKSFDSRYLGPIEVERIIARAVPLYTWK